MTYTIDSQVHAYSADTPDRPWKNKPNWPKHVTGDEMLAAMDAVGVDGAILISAYSIYKFDDSYALEVQNAYPNRFALVKLIDPSNPESATITSNLKKTRGMVGIRILMNHCPERGPDDPNIALILRTAARHDLPVNILFWDRLDISADLIDRFPDTRFIIDHMGIKQPHKPPAPADPFAELPMVLNLAKRPNTYIKISGACTLSHVGYPYPDIWDPLCRVFDAWGIERCLWGTDWTRASAVLSYEQGVTPFRLIDCLTESERTMLMGGTCADIYGWEPISKAKYVSSNP